VRERPTASDECAAAGEAISLRVDSELSPVQEVLLEAHLARCADCRAKSESVVGLTKAIRSAPLVEPSTHFQLPARSGARARVLRMVPATAAVAAVVLSGLLSLHLTATRGSTASMGSIRHLMGFKEQMLEQLDTVKAPEEAIRPSLAEQATLGRPHTRSRDVTKEVGA
jgi:predicted anti-sigma-YlaC factor YlaD